MLLTFTTRYCCWSGAEVLNITANVDLEKLPPSREFQPSPSNPEPDALSRDNIGQRQPATFWVPPASNISMKADAALVDDCTMTESERDTKLDWQKVKEDRMALERQKNDRGERVRRILRNNLRS